MTDSKTTKRALAASIGCMALCVVLLVGTTFAWFTDTASTSVSQVTSGTLDVELYYANNATGGEGSEWTKAGDSTTLYFLQSSSEGTVSQGANILWEPGCTYSLPALQVKNSGSLALKYKIEITGIKGDAKLNEAIEWTINDEKLDSDHSLAAGATSGALTIKGHMKEDAGNEYQDLSIKGITISVVATQDTVEYDSNNNTYDEKATYATSVSSAADLAAAITDGGDVVLTQNVVMDRRLSITGDTTIYGNGASTISVADSLKDNRVITVNDNTDATTLTLSGVTIDGTNVERGLSVFTNNNLNIVVDNSSVSAKYPFSLGNDNTNLVLNVSNSTLTGYGALNNFAPGANATFENCTLIGNNMWSGTSDDFATIVINNSNDDGVASNTTLTFKDCRIEAKQNGSAIEYFLSARASGAKVTFENCTFVYNDKVLTSETDILSHMQLASDAVVTFK